MARVLIVDDDEQFRRMIRKMLQRAGYEVTEAVNGRQGIRLFHEKPMDLVITDILMPVMPGSKLISTLRADFPGLKIIAVSGGGEAYFPENFLEYARDLGADRVMRKPISRTELLQAIEKLMN